MVKRRLNGQVYSVSSKARFLRARRNRNRLAANCNDLDSDDSVGSDVVIEACAPRENEV